MTQRYYHSTGSGRVFGPSDSGETLAAYTARVKRAYGNLRGVKIGIQSEFHPFAFAALGT